MRAVTLARVSTPGQAEHGYSLDDQDRIFLRHIQAKGYTLIEAVRDEGFSGQLSQRPGLTRVMELVAAKVVDVVLFVKMDRVGREQRIILNTIHDIRSRGVRVEFVEHVSGDTPAERLQLGVMASVAEFEWEGIKKRTTDGRYNKARAGAFPSMLKVYGYRQISMAESLTNPQYHGMSGHLVVVEEQAEIIREIYRRFVAGESIRQIGYDLIDRRIPSPRGGASWSFSGLTRILCRPTYIGKLYYGQEECHKVDELTRGGRQRTKRQPRPQEEWVEIPCPAIVDLETWRAAQQRIETNQHAHRGRPSHTWLLRGCAYCGTCTNAFGEPRRLVGHRVTRSKSKPSYAYRNYVCTSLRNPMVKVEGWCKNLQNANKLEALAREMLDEVIQPGRLGELARQQAEEEQRATGDLPAQRAQWQHRLARLDEEERNLIRLARQGAQSALLAEEMQQIQRQRLELQQKIAGAVLQMQALESPDAAARRAEEVSALIRARLEAVTAEEEPGLLQEIYAALFRITVRKDEEPVFEVLAREVRLPGC